MSNRHPVVSIRHELPTDIEAIAQVTTEAFRTLAESSHTEAFIVAALRDAGVLWPSLVAEEDRQIVGHIAFSPVAISDGTPGWFGLGPLSVAPRWQRRRIGSALVQQGMTILRNHDAGGCVLLGHRGFYTRLGFASNRGLVLPGAPPEHFLARHLSGPIPRGEVTYHAAFEATES